jgi:hypothetical protein
MSGPDPTHRRQRQLRQAAHILILILREHPDLPVLTWSVTPDHLHAHAVLCDVEADNDQQVFTAWAHALAQTAHPDPEPALDASGATQLRAVRRVHGLPVILTATVHPF